MLRVHSEKVNLILKSQEAALSAVQIYNNPLIKFKSESFIVLFVIAWTYLLHAYYRSNGIDYRYYSIPKKRKVFKRNAGGSIKYWDLKKSISIQECPFDKHACNNLKFLIGLRNQIEHKNAAGLDSYLSARYQACILNFNYYLKKLHGEKYSLDNHLALSLQFGELDYARIDTLLNKKEVIPKAVKNYITGFDNDLTDDEFEHNHFAYRLHFVRVNAKRKGQADRTIGFIDPKSPLAKNIPKEHWVKEDREKPKFLPGEVVKKIQQNGFTTFSMYKHTKFWQKHDGKNPAKGFGHPVSTQWYWYENWINFILEKLSEK